MIWVFDLRHFFVPPYDPPKCHFLTKKCHFWPTGTKNEKKIHWFICPFHIWRYCMIWVFDLRHFFIPPYDPPKCHFLTENAIFGHQGPKTMFFLFIHMSILYMKILFDMGFWFAKIFWPPKMGGRYLKTPFLATRGPKTKKRRAHCFLEILKI